MKKSDQERLAFVQDLQLPPSEHRLRESLLATPTPVPPPAPDKKAGFIDDGALVSFVAGVSEQHRTDILNSFLLAQLAANKKHDREQSPEDWYKFYHDVLEHLGWVVQDFRFERYEAHGDTMSVQKAILDLLAAVAAGATAAVVVVKETLDALKALSDTDGRIVLWDSATHSAHSGNFQVSAAVESNGTVALKLAAFYFTSTETAKKFLWFGFSSSQMTLKKSGQTMTLNDAAYGAVRQAVVDKLGDAARKYVANIEI